MQKKWFASVKLPNYLGTALLPEKQALLKEVVTHLIECMHVPAKEAGVAAEVSLQYSAEANWPKVKDLTAIGFHFEDVSASTKKELNAMIQGAAMTVRKIQDKEKSIDRLLSKN